MRCARFEVMPLVPDERAVARACQKSCVHERIEHGVARGRIETPEALRLLRRQPQPRHLKKLAANPSNDVLNTP